jgi:3'-phosphoadenosine 5'-phosphosulfate (PAPS) 3'-phosphatase
MSNLIHQSEGSGQYTSLLKTVKLACDEMAPMVKGFYDAINSETSKLKADKSVFTIADGIVQHLLTNYLFAGDKFKAIVGEEDAKVNILELPYTVEDLTVPDTFCEMIDSVREKVSALSSQIDEAYTSTTVFIDPIDGTREFSTGE